jgi:hypothetical protein
MEEVGEEHAAHSHQRKASPKHNGIFLRAMRVRTLLGQPAEDKDETKGDGFGIEVDERRQGQRHA